MMNDRLAGLSAKEKRALLVQTLRRKSGALDKLADAALADHRVGRSKPL